MSDRANNLSSLLRFTQDAARLDSANIGLFVAGWGITFKGTLGD